MNSNNQQSIASQNIPQQNIPQAENATNLPPQNNSKKSSKKKVLIVTILLIILLPILYIFIKLTLTGLVIYSNLSKLPKSTPQTTLQPQTNYVATPLPTSLSNPLEQVRIQARNEKRKLDIDTLGD